MCYSYLSYVKASSLTILLRYQLTWYPRLLIVKNHFESFVFNYMCTGVDLGQWSSPCMKGVRPPPCDDFSLTMIYEDQAVMFGGDTSSGRSFDARVLHLPTMVSHLG